MKKIISLLIVGICLVGLCSCKGKTPQQSTGYKIYYMSPKMNSLQSTDYTPVSSKDDAMGLVEEFISKLFDKKSAQYVQADILDKRLDNNQLHIYLTEDYLKLNKYVQILSRAAIVKTMVQIDGVDSVIFYIKDRLLTDDSGNIVGFLNADSYADTSNDKLEAVQKAEIKLYFANEKGNRLVEESQTVYYSSNISREKVVLERLIAGPTTEKLRPILSLSTKINEVYVKDGVCYINFDTGFLTNENDVEDEVVIYGIVNSLAELPSVYRVQIMVNSKKDVMFMNSLSLNQEFTRNLDIIQKASDIPEETEEPSSAAGKK